MTILNRYLLREYVKILLLTLGILILVFLTIDIFAKFRRFSGYDVLPSVLGSYFLLRIPRVVTDMLPIAVLISTLTTLRLFSRSHELTAVKASGISSRHFAAPILVLTLVISLIAMFVGMNFTPVTELRADYVREVAIKGRPPDTYFQKGRIWFRQGPDRFVQVLLADPDQGTLQGVSIYQVDPDFRLMTLVRADRLDYRDGVWTADRADRFIFNPDDSVQTERLTGAEFNLVLEPDEFRQMRLKPEQMTYRDLKRYLDRLHQSGFAYQRYSVDLHAKTALPFVNLVMGLVGLTFGLREGRWRGVGGAIALSLVIAVAYWLAFSMAVSLGYSGVLPPWLSAWIANIAFVGLGSTLLLGIRQ